MSPAPRLLYCHCQYAQIVPVDVKAAVLRQLVQSGRPFEAVADLCEMSARRDPALRQLAADGEVKIAACFPRAVKWLFHAAGADLSARSTEVLNMRAQSVEEISAALARSELMPNLPEGKALEEDGPNAAPAGPLQS